MSVSNPIKLTMIVPFRDEGVVPWYLERLEDLCRQFPKNDQIEFMVVDSGSIPESRKECERICAENGVTYVFHDTMGEAFQIGAVRDHGVIHAKGAAVSFLDIDLRFADDFYDRLLDLMRIERISQYKNRFFVIPCLYLSKEGTDAFLESEDPAKFTEFYMAWLRGDRGMIETLAPCSSVMVVDRNHYLSVGGHHPEMRGHGYEDFELYHRLMHEAGELPRADHYYSDAKTWDRATYNGFRAQLSVLGQQAIHIGLFVVHLWHPRLKTLSFYSGAHMSKNRERWYDLFKEFDRDHYHPSPLVDADHREKTVAFIGAERSNAARCLRDAIPQLGQVVYLSELDFVDEEGDFLREEFEAVIDRFGIEQIIFQNPYGRDERLHMYRWCRETSFPFLCFERGALPDSWFFDPNGFNADSSSYDARHWDLPLSAEDDENIADYVKSVVTGGSDLEKQGNRVGPEALASRLSVGGRKVLFVPLQRPNDTVIRHMSGALEDWDEFVALIDGAAKHLRRRGWTVLVKKHPLETETPELEYARYVPQDTHFKDLIDLADAVALINSGVGVYTMMANKPTYVFGDAFYAIDGVNKTLSHKDPAVIADEIDAGYDLDTSTTRRFVHYLVNEFYSFGKAKTFTRTEPDGALMTVTEKIDFYELRLPNGRGFSYEPKPSFAIPKGAPALSMFKLDFFNKSRGKAPAREKVAPDALALLEIQKRKNRPRPLRKLIKLGKDPKGFFRDAKFAPLRSLRHVF